MNAGRTIAIKNKILLALTLAVSTLSIFNCAQADDKLNEILKKQNIQVGVRTELKDFGYMNPATNEITGFDIDIAKEISKDIFGKDNAIVLVPVNAQNRTTQLNTGRVDLLAATLSVTPDRMKEVSFSKVYFLSGQSLLVKKDSPIQGEKDLSGRVVCAVVGSSQEAVIRKRVPDAQVLTYSRAPEALLALQGGRCDAFTYGISVLRDMIKSNPNTRLAGGLMTFEAMSLGVKKGDDSLLAAVDTALLHIKQDGRYAAIYKKWIAGDLPADVDSWYGMDPAEAARRYDASRG
ncbi:transporter substrate-binding domain-containing protein [Sodalis sp. RH21]|uniref:transporter substrate-binding domain-containing protein n=1 Tax=unclassified Sodalis (in: enterobacteria) TaxID=2636512 RepID=UPI0039B4196F